MGLSSFKHLRHATGLSQEGFAKLIDYGTDGVRSLEQGKYDVAPRVARSAFVATGVMPVSLEIRDSLQPEAQAWDRTPYTPKHFEAWQQLLKGDLLAGVEGGAPLNRFLAVFGSALSAANKSGKLGRVQALLALALFDALFEEDLQGAARTQARDDGHGADFDALARIAGRIEPLQET